MDTVSGVTFLSHPAADYILPQASTIGWYIRPNSYSLFGGRSDGVTIEADIRRGPQIQARRGGRLTMTKQGWGEQRQHRHHKHERVRHAARAHTSGGRPLAGGLQLPEYHFSAVPGSPRVIYPRGWAPKRPGPVGAALLLGGAIIVLVGIILAIAHIFGG